MEKTTRMKRHEIRKEQLKKIYMYVLDHLEVTFKDIQNLLSVSLTTAKVYFKQAESNFPFESVMIQEHRKDAVFIIKHYEVSK